MSREQGSIKRKLQDYGIKMGDCAKLLHVSRPTLNAYIRQFEAGGRLQSKRYDLIFEKLFGSESPQCKAQFRAELLAVHHQLLKECSLVSLADEQEQVEVIAVDLLSSEDYLGLRLAHLQGKMVACAEARQPIPVKWVIKYNELLAQR